MTIQQQNVVSSTTTSSASSGPVTTVVTATDMQTDKLTKANHMDHHPQQVQQQQLGTGFLAFRTGLTQSLNSIRQSAFSFGNRFHSSSAYQNQAQTQQEQEQQYQDGLSAIVQQQDLLARSQPIQLCQEKNEDVGGQQEVEVVWIKADGVEQQQPELFSFECEFINEVDGVERDSGTKTVVEQQRTKQKQQRFDLVTSVSCLPKNLVAENAWGNVLARAGDVNGREISGEDAYFESQNEQYWCLGVADGVGGWNTMGINPALFAWELMETSKVVADQAVVSLRDRNGANDNFQIPMPWNLLEDAFDRVVKSGAVTAGSSTACLVTFDKQSGELHSANLGDSGFYIFRLLRQPNHDQSKQHRYRRSSSSDRSESASSADVSPDSDTERGGSSFQNSPDQSYDSVQISKSQKFGSVTSSTEDHHMSDGYNQPMIQIDLMYESVESQHYFNAPYQLAILPSHLTPHQRKMFMCDSPLEAKKASFGPLRDGDILVMATDGLFDNLYAEDVGKIVGDCLATVGLRDKNQQSCENYMHDLQVKVNETVENLVKQAAACAVSPRLSPFAKASLEHGWDGNSGGKIDDITVICAVVVDKNLNMSSHNVSDKNVLAS